MPDSPDWIPQLIYFEDYGNDWSRYIDAVYAVFYRDFIENKPDLNGLPVFIKRDPIDQGKESGFWHLISEGEHEENRQPDFRRCERVAWIKAIIEHEKDPEIKTWINKRGRSRRKLLWCEATEYLVVLDARRNHWVLWTAYPVTNKHRKIKLQRDYEACKKS